MERTVCHALLWLVLVWPVVLIEADSDGDMSEDRWVYRHQKRLKDVKMSLPCAHVRPTSKDIVKRFYAILPYFDKDHANIAFLHKFRATVYGMSETDDLLDREAAFYASVLTPIIFFQQYRDMWCLLERRAIRLYQISHPTEKRAALKLLQNLRSVTLKARLFIQDLPGSTTVASTVTTTEYVDTEVQDKKDFRYLRELIKNLG